MPLPRRMRLIAPPGELTEKLIHLADGRREKPAATSAR